MSQNNIPEKLASVERLIQRLNAAEKSQQKEIRITIQEGRELIQDLAILTAKLGKNIQEIHSALVEVKRSSSQIDIRFDGGSFK